MGRRLGLHFDGHSACDLRPEESIVGCFDQYVSSFSVGSTQVFLLLMITDHYRYQIALFRGYAYAALRRATHGRCKGYSVMEPFFSDKYGLEIGGPSRIFGEGRALPVYDRCRKIDASNFSAKTIWSNDATDLGFGYGPCLGQEYVGEASDLSQIPDQRYDFVLACHVLEHVANPLRALQEWKRVLVSGGALLVMVPDKRHIFDHRRPTTSFEHIEADFQANTGENDLTHMDEIVALHDLNLDRGAGSPEEFRERCLRNPQIRAMHHHVFEPELLRRMFGRVGMRTLVACYEGPCHIVGFAEKTVEIPAN